MTDSVKQLAPVIWDAIQKSQKILLHFHVKSDGDSVGGALAMMHVLKTIGKDVTVISGDSEIPPELKTLPGIHEVHVKNYFEINPIDFDLFIIQDSSDIDRVSCIDSITFPPTLKTIVIDHHVTNTNFGSINLVEPIYPAVCELLFDLFKIWGVKISPDIAVCLMVGIYTDTLFIYSGVTSNTYSTAAELAKIAPDFTAVLFDIENNLDSNSLKLMSLYLSQLEHFFNNNVAITNITYTTLADNNIPLQTEVHGVVELMRSVVGNNISILMKEENPGIVTVSMRTRDPLKFDVSKIAVSTGSGGGHPAAAGARIKLPMSQAKEFLLNTIMSVYPDLGRP